MANDRQEDLRRPQNYEEVLHYFNTWESPSGARSQSPELESEKFFNYQNEIDWAWYKGTKKIPAKTWQGLARTWILNNFKPGMVEKKPLPPIEEIRAAIMSNGWADEIATKESQGFYGYYTSRNILLADWKAALAAWFSRGYGNKFPAGDGV